MRYKPIGDAFLPPPAVMPDTGDLNGIRGRAFRIMSRIPDHGRAATPGKPAGAPC